MSYDRHILLIIGECPVSVQGKLLNFSLYIKRKTKHKPCTKYDRSVLIKHKRPRDSTEFSCRILKKKTFKLSYEDTLDDQSH